MCSKKETKKEWPVIVLVILPLIYFCLELADTAQVLRQFLLIPVFCFKFFLHELFDLRLNGPIFDSLDVDVDGFGPMLLRTLVFALLMAVVIFPFWRWSCTQKRKYLVFGIVFFAIIILSSVGFATLILIGISEMLD